MEDGDEETTYAYYCLHQLHMLPSQFFSLDRYERAALVAFIDIRAEDEERLRKKLEK